MECNPVKAFKDMSVSELIEQEEYWRRQVQFWDEMRRRVKAFGSSKK